MLLNIITLQPYQAILFKLNKFELAKLNFNKKSQDFHLGFFLFSAGGESNTLES